MTKKNKLVFTVAFDCENPNHVIVADKLNSLGRKKAGFIAKAVIAYIYSSETTIEPDKSPEKKFRETEAVSNTDATNKINGIGEFMSNLSDFR